VFVVKNSITTVGQAGISCEVNRAVMRSATGTNV